MLRWRERDGVVSRGFARFERCRRRGVDGCVLLVRGRRIGSRCGIGRRGKPRGGLSVPSYAFRAVLIDWDGD